MRLLLGMMWVLHWLPLPVLGRLGSGIGSLLYFIMRPRRNITLTNLRLCMPELSEDARKRLARRHFQAFTRSILERGILWWAPVSRLKRLLHIDPHVPIADLADKPLILLCPHFVCLDVAGVAVSFESSASSIYVAQKNKVFDDALRRGRSRLQPEAKLFSRHEGVKPIVRALREGLPFFMLPDMDFGPRDAEFVPFFGVPAATLTATARLSAMTGARIVPVVARFLPGYRGWRVTFHPPWNDYPGTDIKEATRRMNAFIEERVREAPAEYFWTHKRFKTRPPGAAPVYGPETER